MKKSQLLGIKSCKVLEKGKIDDYGKILDEHWGLKKKVGNFMTNKKIEELYLNLKKKWIFRWKNYWCRWRWFFNVICTKKKS